MSLATVYFFISAITSSRLQILSKNFSKIKISPQALLETSSYFYDKLHFQETYIFFLAFKEKNFYRGHSHAVDIEDDRH